MSYYNVMKDRLLSQENIDQLLRVIYSTYKITPSSQASCAKILRDQFTTYLASISNPPVNEHDMHEGISFLNDRCLTDFGAYLREKFPDKDLVIRPATPVRIMPTSPEVPSTSWPTYVEPAAVAQPPSGMRIVDRTEVNRLLQEHGMVASNPISTGFLEQMANPEVLKMFVGMIKSVNAFQPGETGGFKKIITAAELNALMNGRKSKSPAKKSSKKPARRPPTPESSDSDSSSDSDISSDSDSDSDSETEDDDVYTPSKKKWDVRNIDSASLKEIETRLARLAHFRTIYLQKGDSETVKKITLEKKDLLSILVAVKEQAGGQVASTQAKIKSVKKSEASETADPDTEILDLKIEPPESIEDYDRLIFSLPSRKIKEISLHDYYIPHNPNNITRFNNRFQTASAGKVNRVTIPEGNYDINVLISHIADNINYLEFTVNKNKTITIKNKFSRPFDILVEDGSCLDLLGFTETPDNYRGCTIYHGNQPWDTTVPKKAIFNMKGADTPPLTFETDEKIILNDPIILRNHPKGVSLKNIHFSLKSLNGRNYDFLMPLRLCLRLRYLPVA